MTDDWTAAELTRACALNLTLLAALLAGVVRYQMPRRPRQFAAVLLSTLWVLPALLVLQQLNLRAGWWSYAPGSAASVRGTPVELWLAWAILWGVLPQLVVARLHAGIVAALIAVDLVCMPLCGAAVMLGSWWLVGEAVAVMLVMLPAVALARATVDGTHLRLRALLQTVLAGGLFLYLVPELAFGLRPNGPGWGPLLALHGWHAQVAAQGTLLVALPGIAAVQEFACTGGGTPIPYDPPRRLVVTGVYRYVRNPMQVSCALAMALNAVLLRDGWLVVAAGMSVAYSAGIANWDEGRDLGKRFGQPWLEYRAQVRNWLPRLSPYVPVPATFYVAHSCVPCSQLLAWLGRRRPMGLVIVAAETLPVGTTNRLLYVPAEGAPVRGVRALGRALEHINLGWAMAGALLRLPVVWPVVQLVMDAAGLGPREVSTLQSTAACPLPKNPMRSS